jgi:hypothetical protein
MVDIAVLKTRDGHPIGDLGLEVARGSIPGVTGDVRFGDNESVGTTEAVLWGVPGALFNYLPTSAIQLAVTSTSANDTGAGTGAQTGKVTYLDDDGFEGTETFTFNGQTPVVLTALMKRVQRVEVETAGTGESNEGQIYIYDAADTATAGVPSDLTTIMNGITPDHNQTTSGIYTVPTGKRVFIRSGIVTSAGNKNATIKLRIRFPPDSVFKTKLDFDTFNNTTNLQPFVALLLPASADLRVTGQVDTGTGRASVSWSQIIEDWTI